MSEGDSAVGHFNCGQGDISSAESQSRQVPPNPALASYEDIRRRAVQAGSRSVTDNAVDWNPRSRTLFKLLLLSQETSFSILCLARRGFVTSSLILLRARTEQQIVASYLIHEDPEKGVEPFMQHASVSSYLTTKSAFEDSEIRPFLADRIDLKTEKAKAVASMSELKPDFHTEVDDFRREWTNLSLEAMAQRRDKLATALGSPSSNYSLRSLYATAYRTYSSVVHADSLAISPSFLGTAEFHAGTRPVLAPNLIWVGQIFCLAVICDLIQLDETLSFLGVDVTERISGFVLEWTVLSEDLGFRADIKPS